MVWDKLKSLRDKVQRTGREPRFGCEGQTSGGSVIGFKDAYSKIGQKGSEVAKGLQLQRFISNKANIVIPDTAAGCETFSRVRSAARGVGLSSSSSGSSPEVSCFCLKRGFCQTYSDLEKAGYKIILTAIN